MTNQSAARIEIALRACIEAAPERTRNALAQAIEDYAEQQPRRPAQDTMMGVLLDAMIEASDARPKADA